MIVMRLSTGVRSHFVTRLPEWALASTLLGFAVLLLSPTDTFGSSPQYRLLARVVSECAWGWFALVVSVVWLMCLVLNGTFRRFRRWSPLGRSLCALCASTFWGANTVAIFLSQPSSPGLVNNAGYAVLALASSIITAREVGAVDGNAKKCPQPTTLKTG